MHNEQLTPEALRGELECLYYELEDYEACEDDQGAWEIRCKIIQVVKELHAMEEKTDA